MKLTSSYQNEDSTNHWSIILSSGECLAKTSQDNPVCTYCKWSRNLKNWLVHAGLSPTLPMRGTDWLTVLQAPTSKFPCGHCEQCHFVLKVFSFTNLYNDKCFSISSFINCSSCFVKCLKCPLGKGLCRRDK